MSWWSRIFNRSRRQALGPTYSGARWGGIGGAGRARELAAFDAVSTLFGIVDRTSQATGMVGWNLYRKAANGDKADRKLVAAHPALSVLRAPNRWYSTAMLFRSGQQHIDLTGVSHILVVREGDVITELWPLRPDRIEAVRSATEFIAGWIYRSPDGEMVPLSVDDVLWNRNPDPRDPYGGSSPVASLLADLEGDAAAARWNANFFKNNATPGGVIQTSGKLSDQDFRTARRRWAEQHQGVDNAGRVAILEWGEYKTVAFSQKDMDLSALRNLNKQNIREAYGFPQFMTGTVTDVNRANAEASEVLFGRWLVVPRVEAWKDVLNNQFLPMFGGNWQRYEFDYDSPVPDSAEDEDRGRDSKVAAYVALLGAGVDPAQAAETCGLPVMKVKKPEPVVVPSQGGGDDGAGSDEPAGPGGDGTGGDEGAAAE